MQSPPKFIFVIPRGVHTAPKTGRVQSPPNTVALLYSPLVVYSTLSLFRHSSYFSTLLFLLFCYFSYSVILSIRLFLLPLFFSYLTPPDRAAFPHSPHTLHLFDLYRLFLNLFYSLLPAVPAISPIRPILLHLYGMKVVLETEHSLSQCVLVAVLVTLVYCFLSPPVVHLV